jgi:hypothetical protein
MRGIALSGTTLAIDYGEPSARRVADSARKDIMVATTITRPATTTRQTITLCQQDNQLRLEPVPAEVMESLLATTHSASQVPGCAFGVHEKPILLGQLRSEAGHDVLYTKAAMEPVVRTALAKAGYAIRTSGTPLGELPAPNLDNLRLWDLINPSVIDFVRAKPRGIIRNGYKVDPSWLIAQVALAWPTMKIAVVVRTHDEASRVGAALGDLVSDVSVIAGSRCPSEVSQLVVTTYEGLAQTPRYKGPDHSVFDVSWLDMIFVLDAHDAVSKVAMQALSRALRARLYGFPSRFQMIPPLDRDHQATLFGFAELVVPEEGYRQRQVEVLRYPIKGGMDLAKLSDVALKRQGIWHNELRNRKVARLAQNLLKDPRLLARMLQLPETDAALEDRSPGNIAVVVENLEHALALNAKLPEFFISHGSEASTEGLSPEQVQLLNRQPGPFAVPPLGIIVTTTALKDPLKDLNLRIIDVLIRADAGSDLPPINADSLIERDSNIAKPLLLVDFHDRQHPALRRLSRLRQQAYQKRGWLPPGADPEQARVDQFLATRPRRPSR